MAVTDAGSETEIEADDTHPIEEASFFYGSDEEVGGSSGPDYAVMKAKTVLTGRQLEMIREQDEWEMLFVAVRDGHPVVHFERTE